MTPYLLRTVPMEQLLPALEAVAPKWFSEATAIPPMWRLLSEWCFDLAETALAAHTPESLGWREPLALARRTVPENKRQSWCYNATLKAAYGVSKPAGNAVWVLCQAWAVADNALRANLGSMTRATWDAFCECMPTEAQTEARERLLTALGVA